MSCSKPKYMPSYDFTGEVLSEILKRLPVKYVLRCRCVQKSWYHLIGTPMFISLHSSYQRMTAHVNPKYLLFHNLDAHILSIRYDDEQCQEYRGNALDLQVSSESSLWFAESNGLICLSDMFHPVYHHDNRKIVMWNPLIERVKRVPDSPLFKFKGKFEALAFGFLPQANDYVVVHIVKLESIAGPDEYGFDPYRPVNLYEQCLHKPMIGLYSLKTDSWKMISQDKVFVDDISANESVFVNSTAFWVGYNHNDCYQLVMFLDTKTTLLRQVKVPDWIVPHSRQLVSPRILPFGQSIAYFVEIGDFDSDDDEEDVSPHLEIWVLNDTKDIIDEHSWEEKMSVTLGENVSARILGIRNNNEPILAKLKSMISYNLHTHEPYDFVDSCDHFNPSSYYEEASRPPFDIRPFVETLDLLDIGLKSET